ncbi:transmembrane domain-containing protein [Hypoxylon trugodes]|uniref:transmembrane domain-containing protein n=1 Tax=Hypoxylon trugodes TaxID=326681 RepID=UPI0021A0FF15|nr:transmembrane domain-containing protein [Hypoxylon trugodes]KAI1382699.1 transmembrane domain-containing protein [Hypoxylon trugodes]
MDVLKDYLPAAKGYLPYYLVVTSIIAFGNALQNYVTLHFSRRLYNGQFVPNPSLPPKSAAFNPEDSTRKLVPASSVSNPKEARTQDQVTPLAARLFGTYTVVSAIVRIYAAYNLHLAPIYHITIWTYVVALAHFGTEFAVFKTAYMGPVASTFAFATAGIIWMTSQYSFYVEA